jgi:hypothetical protein
MSSTKRLSSLALHGVRDFGVELHGVVATCFVGHAGDGAGGRGGHDLEAGGSSVTLSPWLIQTLSMPWPSAGEVFDAFQQLGVAMGAHFGVTEFAGVEPSTLPPSWVAMVCMP